MRLKTKTICLITILVVLVGCGSVGGCNPQINDSETPAPCRKVFEADRLDIDAAKTFSMSELIVVEKCGFRYHPTISFYSEIVDSREYPIPGLLTELRRADDEHWRAHLIYLIKAVIEYERFYSDVMRDRKLITYEVDLAFEKTNKESGEYERINDLRDGIEIYFSKQSAEISERPE